MFTLAALISLASAPAPGFTEQVLGAHAIVELTVELTPSKASEETQLLGALRKKREVSRVVLAPPTPPETWPVPALRAWKPGCPADKPRLSMLALYKADEQGRWTGVALHQQAQGRGTDRDVGYNLVVEAVTEARQWTEERMRAVGAELLWQRERAALHNDNPYLRALAVTFLAAHGAADVVDKEWGAPGSDARKAEEAKARLPEPACARQGK